MERTFVVFYWRGNPQLRNGGRFGLRKIECASRSVRKKVREKENPVYGTLTVLDVWEERKLGETERDELLRNVAKLKAAPPERVPLYSLNAAKWLLSEFFGMTEEEINSSAARLAN